MSKKIILLTMLIIASLFISGCVFEDTNKTNKTIAPDFIPRTNLPTGYTFMGIHDTQTEIANTTVSMFEGVYRYGGDDIYIQAFKHDNPETLLSQFKADQRKKFREDYDPFEDISINGHAATKFADVGILNGKEQKKYSIIWAKGDYMVMVGSSSDPMVSSVLASATGY